MSTELADVASTPDAAVIAAPDSSPGLETPVAPQGDVAASVTGTGEEGQQPPDFFEGIPPVEQLQTEVERKVPYSEAVLRLRTELERVRPEYQRLEGFKDIVADQTPERLKEQLGFQDLFFSKQMRDGQVLRDDRGLPYTTAKPFFDQQEVTRPGFVLDHAIDVLDYQVRNPETGQSETVLAQLFRTVLGLDATKLQQYQNIDALIAKTNGNLTPQELDAAIPVAGLTDPLALKNAQADREAFKTLPSSIRKDWEVMDEEEKRYHLDGAKERIEARQFRQQSMEAAQRAEQEERQQFEQEIAQTFTQDLAQIRTNAFSSLRDNLAKDWKPTADDAINQDRYDDVLAPLVHLIDPDLQPMALQRLEREGIKINAQEFNEQMRALVAAREEFVRANAFGVKDVADRANREFTRLNTQMMSKFNNIVFQRAQRYGYQAKAIAQVKGDVLSAASQVRPVAPGNAQVPANQPYIDPRSPEAVMRDYQASLGQGAAG